MSESISSRASAARELIMRSLGWVRDQAKWLLPNLQARLGLASIAAILGIAGFLVEQNVGLLHEHIMTLQDTLRTERAQHEAQIGTLKQQISDMLPASVSFPIPYDPPNGAALVGDYVTLRWNEKSQHPNYIVEMTRLDPANTDAWRQAETFDAADPSSLSTRYPPSPDSEIVPGTYLWRVIPGNKEGGIEQRQGDWSGYYKFTVYRNVIERMKGTKKLHVGVSYVQNSKFMSKDPEGNALGFDADLINMLAEQLSTDHDIGTHLQTSFLDYPTVDQILFHGILEGEADLAIGSITRAKYREKRGIQFSHGYFESRLVLLSAPGGEAKLPLDADDKVGILKESANFEAAQFLKKTYSFEEVYINSWPGLIDALMRHKVDFIVIDKPLASSLIDKGQVVVAKDLTPDIQEYLEKMVGYDKEEYAIATGDHGLHDKIEALMTTPENKKRIASLKVKYHLSQP